MAPDIPKRFRVTCLQINSGSDWHANIQNILNKITAALRVHPHLIALPENCFFRGEAASLGKVADAVFDDVIPSLKMLAKKRNINILIGSTVERAPVKGKFYNTSLLIASDGTLAAKYRKIHLFDISLPNMTTRESDQIQGGREIVTGRVGGVRVGLAICYDLRFPELFRALTSRGAKMIFVPAHFTYKTGKAHWEVLLRARAIENQVYIIAPNQVGIHPENGIRSYGTSLIIDPWGKVLARGSVSKEQILTQDLDFCQQDRLRKSFPVLQHIRLNKIRL